ncbi:MAG: DUF4340 domain-containing protein [Eubacteriales bacterium]|nr:DUF4340 domain-containing protein [Eubacteriales bacterium]
MKSSKFVIILVSILAVLAASYFLIGHFNKPAGESTAAPEYVIKLEVEDVEKVTVVNKDQTYVIERSREDISETNETNRTSEEWILTYPENLDFDPAKLKNIVYNAYSITAERVVEEEAADLAKYGFDQPVSVTLKTGDGGEYTIEVGDITSTGGARYVKMKDSAKVCTMGKYSSDILVFEKNYIRTTHIYDISAEDIFYFALYKQDGLSYEATKDAGGGWDIGFPVEAEAESEVMAEITASLEQLYIAEHVDENPDSLEEYGLDDPKHILEFETEKTGKVSLTLGKEDGADIYAQYSERVEVIKVPLSGLGFLDKPLKEILYPFLYIKNIDDVSGMMVVMDGYTLDIAMETGHEDSSEDRFYINGKDVSMADENNKQRFRSYYEALISLRISDVAPGEEPAGDPEMAVSYTLKENSEVMKLEFVSRDSTYYYVLKNGIYSGLLFEKSDLDMDESSYGVRAMYRMLMDFIDSYQKPAETTV